MAAAESLIPGADAAIRQMTFHAPNSSNLPTRVMLTRRLSSALDFLLGKNRGNVIKVLIMSSSEDRHSTLVGPSKHRCDVEIACEIPEPIHSIGLRNRGLQVRILPGVLSFLRETVKFQIWLFPASEKLSENFC